MLPIVFPQATDLLNFESATALPELVPAEAAPVASFSSLLGLVQELPLQADGSDGQLLPDAGKGLPLPDTLLDDMAVPADQTEPEESGALAALLLPAPVLQQAPAQTGPADPARAASGLPAAPQGPLPLETLAKQPQPAERIVAAATVEAPPLEQQLRSETLKTPVPAPAQPSGSAAETILQRGIVAAPVAPVAQPARELRPPAAPAPGASVAGLEPETEPVWVERQMDARPVLSPVETRAPAAVMPELRERIPSFTESQTPIQTPATASIAGPAARAPVAELPNALMSTTISTTVTDPNWGEELAQRVQIMASNRLQTAEIRLSPAELGPLRVQISVDDGAATVGFQAQHAVTRDAIEQALPRLREMLAENGLSLSQASVGEQDGQAGSRESGDGDERGLLAGSEATADGSVLPETPGTRRQSDGLVDTFA